MQPLMRTDSERLMREGVQAAVPAFDAFLDEMGWSRDEISKTFCHQVGVAQRKLLFEALGLEPAIDFTTLEFLGNTGSAALPITAALGIERGHLSANDRVAMMGIGSGINVLMLGVEWQRAAVVGGAPRSEPAVIGRAAVDS
jgi:3-oxoacyl-[acyl-carrier-protein] synthase-3